MPAAGEHFGRQAVTTAGMDPAEGDKKGGRKRRRPAAVGRTNRSDGHFLLHFALLFLLLFHSTVHCSQQNNSTAFPSNCTLTRDMDNRASSKLTRLHCPSLSAFQNLTDRKIIGQIERLDLVCAPAKDDQQKVEEEEAQMALQRLGSQFSALRHLSIQNCPNWTAQHMAALPRLEWLNLSGNGLTQLGWQQIGSTQLRLLDISRENGAGGGGLECGKCENAWMRPQLLDGHGEAAESGWSIRSLFPTIPERVLLPQSLLRRNCSFSNCPRERAKFDPMPTALSPELRLGGRLEMKCRFWTDKQLLATTTEQKMAAAPVFVWPLNEPPEEAEGNVTADDGGVQTVLLPAENAALLRIAALRSSHLGLVACRCMHCAVPHFDIVPLRFPVPISVHIPPGQPPGEQHLTLHGYPLDAGHIRMEITRLADNKTEVHQFIADAADGGGGKDGENDRISNQHSDAQPKAQLFFDGSLAVRPEPAHSQFFLRYFSLSVHECPHCAHSQSGDLFRFRICMVKGSSSEKEAEAEADNCASAAVVHRMEPPVHSVSRQGPQLSSANASTSVSLSSAILHFLLSLPPILLSLALLSLGARTIWRLKQRMAIREKLKRRSRRASRNTQRTEETSIPLDTMSRSLSLSNYIQSQLHVPLIDSRELQLNERIGKGAFGEVFVAVWRRRQLQSSEGGGTTDSGVGEPAALLDDRQQQQQADEEGGQLTEDGGEQQQKVAVKMLTNVQMDVEMDREAALLARLEHPNVLRMFGIAHWSGQVALVLELMNLGDLRNYLRNREPRCNNYAQFPPALVPTELVDICIQICEGLCYLAGQQVVHRDLAARNCLVSGPTDMRCCSAAFRPPICVKISDFGMSRRLYASTEYYRMQDKKTALPVRWMPPECLSSGKFTTQSDIWSFGVLLYEVFSFGGMPFAALSNGEVLTAVLGGMRPEVPERCGPELAALMRDCWHRCPQKRILALEALQRLRQIQQAGGGTANADDN